MDKIATAHFLAKMIHTGKTTYDAVIKKYPNLKELIDKIGEEQNLNFNNIQK